MELAENKMGRPVIPLDPATVKELLASSPLSKVAELLGVHRNTLYRRAQADPAFQQLISNRHTRPALDARASYLAAFGTLHEEWRLCKPCGQWKPAREFPYKVRAGAYRKTCRVCTYRRWNELHAQKAEARDEARKKLVARLLLTWTEAAWHVRCFNRIRVSEVVKTKTVMGRPWRPIDIDLLRRVTEQRRRSLREIARLIGIPQSTLFHRTQRDIQIAELVLRGTGRPTYTRHKLVHQFMPGVAVNSLAPEEIIRIVDNMLGRAVRPADRTDFCYEIVTMLLAGEVNLQDLPYKVPEILRTLRKRYSAGFISLDKRRGEGKGYTLLEYISADDYGERFARLRAPTPYGNALADCRNADDLAERLRESWAANRLLNPERRSYGTKRTASHAEDRRTHVSGHSVSNKGGMYLTGKRIPVRPPSRTAIERKLDELAWSVEDYTDQRIAEEQED